MASGFSVYLDNKVLDFIFTGTNNTTPTKYWALFLSDNGLSNNTLAEQNEVNGAGYARVEADNVTFSAASESSVTNLLEVQFPVADEDWGTVTHVALMDAATQGNVLAFAEFMDPTGTTPRPKAIMQADQLVIRARGTVFQLLDDNSTVGTVTVD